MKDGRDNFTLELPEVGRRRPGRPKVSRLSSRELNAKAQRDRRTRLQEAGFAWRGFWLSPDALEGLEVVKRAGGLPSRDDALNRVLERLAQADSGDKAALLVQLLTDRGGAGDMPV